LANFGNLTPIEGLEDEDLSTVVLEDAIDWNTIEDPKDVEIWNRLISNFWVPEKIALSNDLHTWSTLTEAEKTATVRVFAGLTLLDTIQGKVGAISMIPDARTPQEVAVLTNISFMEEIHAKSYSSIFSTLISSPEIKDAFRWSRENVFLKRKAAIILKYYRGDDPEKRKIASTLLESFLFYSGFFMPLWWESKAKLTNCASIIKLIIRDESVHGYYLGYKYQLAVKEATPERQAELKNFALSLMKELYENEEKYTEHIYDDLNITEHVKTFLRYNCNKSLNNLGYESVFTAEETDVLPQILSSLSPSAGENSDFFSSTPNYVMGATSKEETEEEDWDF
jgi:ribonucleoside-diphosphate reductase beta chain